MPSREFTRAYHQPSACNTATTAVSTISSAVAPRDRSATGLASPWRMGPIAHDPPAVPRRGGAGVRELLRGRLRHDGAVGEGQHRFVPHHVEGAADGRDPRRGADRPERGPDRVAARKGGPPDHHVREPRAHEARSERERVLERGARRVVGGKPVRPAGAEMLYEAGDGGRGQGPPQHLDYPETTRLQLRRRRAHPRVVALGEHDVLPRAARPFIDAVAEAHRPNFWCNAWRTAGWTSCDTSPPNRATSRTRLDERYVRSNAGTRNTVSIPGARLRFISAIWNSYSKSLTARRPRTITDAPTERANSASSPSNARTSTLGSAAACLMSATRSSRVKSGCFATFTATATTTLSAKVKARRIRSSCPRVMGSNEPG